MVERFLVQIHIYDIGEKILLAIPFDNNKKC